MFYVEIVIFVAESFACSRRFQYFAEREIGETRKRSDHARGRAEKFETSFGAHLLNRRERDAVHANDQMTNSGVRIPRLTDKSLRLRR
jgi:hypothetical protein